MSSSTAPAETRDRGRLAWGLQALLAVAYLVVAHVASVSGDGRFAAVALLLVVALVLVPALLRGRLPAWLLMAVAALLAAWLAPSTVLWLPLRLVPVAFVGLVAFGVARTLRAGRVPLVTRIVSALDRTPPAALPADLQAYARAVTRAWAWLLGALALFDLWMALHATPEQWSWLANIGDYVVIGGFLLLEFAWRRRRFPAEARSFPAFVRGMLALGPAFWRSVASP